MSFLKQLQDKKQILKSTQTVITQADGSSYIENYESRIGKSSPEKLDHMKYGFVVDNKPDKIPIEVIKNLYIGSQDCTDPDILREYDIVYALSLGVNVICENVLEHKFIECLDLPETDIQTIVSECNKFIFKALRENKNVLVHCNAGVSRSAMVILGYLIVEKKIAFADAFSLLKAKRPCIQPNAGFMKQLQKM